MKPVTVGPAGRAAYECDLHSHTTRSDGNDTPRESIDRAAARGLRVLAITDHDVLPPAEVSLPDGSVREIHAYAGERGVCLLRGIEFSCETEIQDVHIVGFGCDWEGPDMAREVACIAESKSGSYLELIRRLNERGYRIDLAELLAAGGREIPVAELQKKAIFDYMAAKGYVSAWSEAKLLVREDPALNVEREKPGALRIIEAIHRAGGTAILAHPYLIDEQVRFQGERIGRWRLIERLAGAGLDGMEVRYTYDKTTCKDRRPPEAIWAEVRSRMPEGLFVSGGSDYHADYKKGQDNPRDLGECGLTMEEFLSVPVFARLYRTGG